MDGKKRGLSYITVMAAIIISGKGGNVGSINRAEDKTRPETNEKTVRGERNRNGNRREKSRCIIFGTTVITMPIVTL